MTKTLIYHDVPKSDVKAITLDLRADGYQVSSRVEDDGEYTVTGTKEVPDSASPAKAASGTGVVPKKTKKKTGK